MPLRWKLVESSVRIGAETTKEFGTFYIYEEFEDTKRVNRMSKSKDRQHNGEKKKGQTTIDKTYR
jgi:hypothetical protein